MLENLIKEINILKERIEKCTNDREAIAMQQRLTQILIETMTDPEVLKELAMRGKNLNDFIF